MDKIEINEIILSDEAKKEIVAITDEIDKIETALKEFKTITDSYDKFRKKLFETMTKHGLYKYVSTSGIQFTITTPGKDKVEIKLKFDEDRFKKEKPAMYKRYTKQVEAVSKGKASYLRITLPNEEE